jgi:hypothetical protein
MLQDKDINKISELKRTFVDTHKNQNFFDKIISLLKLGKYHAFFSMAKVKGIPVLQLMSILISFPFIGQKNVHDFAQSNWRKFVGCGKDTFYRLINNANMNWRGFLYAVLLRTLLTISGREMQENNTEGVKALIFDDSPIEKTGKLIEGISRIWNHVINRHILGFQLLVMGLYTGSIFLPVDFSLHREKGKNKNKPYGLKTKHIKKQFRKKRGSKTRGAKRKNELDQSKIKSVVQMIKSAVKKGITADYVLTDSWFTCFETVKTTLENNMHYIGMFSKVKTKFLYNNKNLTYKEIRRIHRKNTKRNKRFNLYYNRIVVNWNGQDVVLYATRKGKNGKWKFIICTDLSLNFTQTVEIYQLRWSIEVFFKESKQLLDLGKSQSRDFDAQIADITLTMTQYIFLALQNGTDRYESLGKLFEKTKMYSTELRLHQRLIALLIAVIELIESLFEDADYENVFQKVMHDEKAQKKLFLLAKYEFKNDNLAA